MGDVFLISPATIYTHINQLQLIYFVSRNISRERICRHEIRIAHALSLYLTFKFKWYKHENNGTGKLADRHAFYYHRFYAILLDNLFAHRFNLRVLYCASPYSLCGSGTASHVPTLYPTFKLHSF